MNYHRSTRGGGTARPNCSVLCGGEKIVFHRLSVVNEKCNGITQVPQIVALLRVLRLAIRKYAIRTKSEYNAGNLRLRAVLRVFGGGFMPISTGYELDFPAVGP